MTTVYCNNSECKYLKDGLVCSLAMISLDEDGECEDFEDCRNDTEWQKVFWKRMFDRENKRECRVAYHGKELMVGGRIFYVDSNSYYAILTDKETGFACGNIARLNESDNIIGKITEMAKKCSLLTELPIAEYDEKTRKYSYPSEESEDTE